MNAMEIPPHHSPKVHDFIRACLRSSSIPSRRFWVIADEIEREIGQVLDTDVLRDTLFIGPESPLFSHEPGMAQLWVEHSYEPNNRSVDAVSLTDRVLAVDKSNLLVFSHWLAENHSLLDDISRLIYAGNHKILTIVELTWFSSQPKVFKNENGSYSRKDLYEKFLVTLNECYVMARQKTDRYTTVLNFESR